MISLLNPSSREPKCGRSKTLWNSTPYVFTQFSDINLFFFMFFGFAEVIYIAVVTTLTTHSFCLQTQDCPSRWLGNGLFFPSVHRPSVVSPRWRPLRRAAAFQHVYFGSSSRESVSGSIGAAGPRSGCFKRFIVFFNACLLLQNQTRTTSLS